MSEKEPESKEGAKKGGWLKTIFGTLAGLLSGAIMMYASPLLDKIIKPAKPVANFAVESDNLTVSFHNRSSGGSEGWWDFGDGSPLEPVSPKQELVTHTYTTYAEYTAKLKLRNLLGEESERSVPVVRENPKSAPPSIDFLEVTPLSKDAYAPATFRIRSQIKNAQLCVWDFGDESPLEFSTDIGKGQERFVTFKKPGGYVIKMAAVNGDQAKERTEIIYVDEPPKGMVTAMLSVSEQATRLEKRETSFTFGVPFPASTEEATFAFDRFVPARHGYEIVDARLPDQLGQGLALQGRNEMAIPPSAPACPGVKSLTLKLAADRQSLHLVGELEKETGVANRNAPLPNLVLPVLLTQQHKSPATRPTSSVASAVPAPGAALLSLPPVPADWTDVHRQVHLELREGERIIWQDSQLPRNAPIVVGKRPCTLSVQQVGDQVQIVIDPAQTGLKPTAN